MGNILIDSKTATKLADIAVFLHACLIEGISSTQEIFLMELLVGATLRKIVVHGISFIYTPSLLSTQEGGQFQDFYLLTNHARPSFWCKKSSDIITSFGSSITSITPIIFIHKIKYVIQTHPSHTTICLPHNNVSQ